MAWRPADSQQRRQLHNRAVRPRPPLVAQSWWPVLTKRPVEGVTSRGQHLAVAPTVAVGVDLHAVQAAERYMTTFEMLVGKEFTPGDYPAGPRIGKAMQQWDVRP